MHPARFVWSRKSSIYIYIYIAGRNVPIRFVFGEVSPFKSDDDIRRILRRPTRGRWVSGTYAHRERPSNIRHYGDYSAERPNVDETFVTRGAPLIKHAILPRASRAALPLVASGRDGRETGRDSNFDFDVEFTEREMREPVRRARPHISGENLDQNAVMRRDPKWVARRLGVIPAERRAAARLM